MAKTTAKSVWERAIKAIGNGWVKFIAKCNDIGATTFYVGQSMMLSATAGELVLAASMGTNNHTEFGLSVAEPIVDNDRFFLAKKLGAEILHNQKLASTYSIGDAVIQTATGTWTIAVSSTGAHLLQKLGFVVGPVDRVTGGVLKGIGDAFTATEPVDILI
ncbi:hypothetical protein LCGC14_1982060 [marine sediment metagenome]|uniref:Uncharacterized protein n=1 Tax=marine sediment metagenome TaxID=412755 RepID=A0A0F9F8S5_9ZZZZ